MDLFAEIADERRRLADELASLTPRQQDTASLCGEWTVREVLAHLIVPLEVGLPEFARAMLASRGSFDRANVRLARTHAQRPFADIIDTLRRKADTRFTPPGSGPQAPLTDVLVHGLDIRWPLGMGRPLDAERARTTLTFLTTSAARRLVPSGLVGAVRLEAEDLGWSHGQGPVLRGGAEALLLVMTGRAAGLDRLEGEGLAPAGELIARAT